MQDVSSSMLAVLDQVPTNAQIAELAQSAAAPVLEGEIAAVPFAVRLKAAEQLLSGIKELVSESVVAELEKFPKGKGAVGEVKIETAETGVKYDYSGDAKWADINAQIEKLTEKRKEREALLKTLKEPMTEIDDNGEAIEVPVPLKTSTTTYKVTLQKVAVAKVEKAAA